MVDILTTPVTELKGVGPRKASALNKLGINTINDLLTYFPFRYEDVGVKDLTAVQDHQKVALKGIVATDPTMIRFGRYKSRLNFNLLIDHNVVRVTFFNQPYLSKKLQRGEEVILYGTYDVARQSLSGIKIIAENTGQQNDFTGVYNSSKEIKAGTIKKLVHQAYENYHGSIRDIIPGSLRRKFRLLSREQMIKGMHFPVNAEEATQARRTAIFEEFFLFQAGLQELRKLRRQEQQGVKIDYNNKKLREFIQQIPFELTKAQKRVVNEICSDMHRPIHMNRLLQGDVGSGKTIVATIAMYAAVTAGWQSVLMAPTEILAEQHADKLATLLSPMGVNVALVTGNTVRNPRLRRELLTHIEQGDVDIIIGTQALIQERVHFAQLGLVIIDEQHRFGVEQRQTLLAKGGNPDVLTMTATPIPRTLAITTYGEMDLSVIDELPAGRKQVQTVWYNKKQVGQVRSLLREQLDQGAQAYVISPLIEKSAVIDLKNAEEVYQNLKDHFEPRYSVGLLHGNMTNDEKNQVMQAFKAGELAILASTTVIEVGVDVPNATVMVILDADRFGLAQLHQLRGRVGRGDQQSYCVLVADPKNDFGKKRMETMVATTNGFVIAQKDLELRGQGDLLGKKQSGLPSFKVGDPVTNLNILQVAQQAAHDIINADDYTTNNENRVLIEYLHQQIDNGSRA